MQRDVGRLVELATKFKEVGCLGLFLVRPPANRAPTQAPFMSLKSRSTVRAAMEPSLDTAAPGDVRVCAAAAAATNPSLYCLSYASRAWVRYAHACRCQSRAQPISLRPGTTSFAAAAPMLRSRTSCARCAAWGP